jgi:hypothetical protein
VNQWTKVTQTFPATATNVTYVHVLMEWTNATSGRWAGTLYLDDFCVSPSTVTPVSTPTPGGAVCGAGTTKYFGFDDGTTMDWDQVYSWNVAATGAANSTVRSHCGAGCLAMPFAADEATGKLKIECHNITPFSPALDVGGKAVSIWVYIEAAEAPPSGTVALQICGGDPFGCASWTDNLPVNKWTQVTQTFGAGVNLTTLDLQVIWNHPGTGETWTGTVYLDELGWQ